MKHLHGRCQSNANAGLLNPRQQLLFSGEFNWLFAYTAALPMAFMIGRLTGAMIAAYL